MEDTSTGSEPDARPDRAPDEPVASDDAPDDVEAGDDAPDDVEAGDHAPDDDVEAGDHAPDDDVEAGDHAPDDGGEADDLDALRERVDEEYDFDDFGPADMARMSPDEWDAAFDPETWITGDRLLDRVEAELKSRIARRDVFGVLERVREDGEERILVYSDEGYVIVRPSGEIAGDGTILRDVEPIIALAAMESYDVPEPPDDWSLPHPDSVPEGSGEFGNLMIQTIALVQFLAGGALLVAWLFTDLDTVVAPAMGLVFLFIGLFLFVMVANARLSDRFRSEEYRNRLRALREAKERPDFVPVEGGVVDEGDRED